jgi:hypothetical protein
MKLKPRSATSSCGELTPQIQQHRRRNFRPESIARFRKISAPRLQTVRQIFQLSRDVRSFNRDAIAIAPNSHPVGELAARMLAA